MTDAVPRLATRRLVLSGPAPADLDGLEAIWADAAVFGRLGGRPPLREEIWHRLLRYIGHWSAFGYGTWIIHDTASGLIAGEIGLMASRRATQPVFDGVPEIGWALAGWAQGHGMASEALTAVLAWCDRRSVPRLVAMMSPDNAPSLRLAIRHGFRSCADGRYRDAPVIFLDRQHRPGSAGETGQHIQR